jgi:hypothetical protein
MNWCVQISEETTYLKGHTVNPEKKEKENK